MELYETEMLDGVGGSPPSPGRNSTSSIPPHWSYSDGSPAVPPSEVTPPDEWTFVGEWEAQDTARGYGWCYGHDFASLSKEMSQGHQVRMERRRRDTCRRRKWTRTLRPCETRRDEMLERALALESDFVAVRVIEKGEIAPARAKEQGAGGKMEEEKEDIDVVDSLLFHQKEEPELLQAEKEEDLPSIKGKILLFRELWAREFVFRGWGFGLTKPLRSLLSTQGGVAFKLPITSYFRRWHSNLRLPMITLSILVSSPLCIQAGISVSYPMGRLAGGARLALLRLASIDSSSLVPKGSGSRSVSSGGSRDTTVKRLGLSLGLAYSFLGGGFRWWMAPMLLIRPSLNVIIKFTRAVLGLVFPYASYVRLPDAKSQMGRKAKKISRWAKRKSTGIGCSLIHHRDGMRTSILLDFQPFMLPRRKRRKIGSIRSSTSTSSSTSTISGPAMPAAAPAPAVISAPPSSKPLVTLDAG